MLVALVVVIGSQSNLFTFSQFKFVDTLLEESGSNLNVEKQNLY